MNFGRAVHDVSLLPSDFVNSRLLATSYKSLLGMQEFRHPDWEIVEEALRLGWNRRYRKDGWDENVSKASHSTSSSGKAMFDRRPCTSI